MCCCAGRRGVRELRPARGLRSAACDGRRPQRLHRRGEGGRSRELRREGVACAGGGACGRSHLPRPRRRPAGSATTRSPQQRRHLGTRAYSDFMEIKLMKIKTF